ncbi:MAG: transcription antitermination factor NusB [Coriobacteriaceae bacterium]|nr:transcription antitermination factor NusB [Coriobacteriaceae bacterium]
MAKVTPARRVALNVLMEAEQTGRYARELMPAAADAARLDARDAAFAMRLALGVTSTRGCLDDALDAHLDKPKKVAARVRMALRIAAFEALYLNTAPEVAVSQGVELVNSFAKGASGLANAVLRRVCACRDAFLSAEDAAPEQREMVARARRAGLPVWLVRRVVESLGEDRAQEVLDAQCGAAPLAVHANPLRERELVRPLHDADALPLALPGALSVAHVGPLVSSGSFAHADAVASDYHAQLIAAAATRAGSCLEIGAGRGTKTFMMLAHVRRRQIEHAHVALDMYEGKCRANAVRIERADLGGLELAVGDATDLDACLAEYDAHVCGCVAEGIGGRAEGHASGWTNGEGSVRVSGDTGGFASSNSSVRVSSGTSLFSGERGGETSADRAVVPVDADFRECALSDALAHGTARTCVPAGDDSHERALRDAVAHGTASAGAPADVDSRDRVLFDTVFVDAPCSGTGTMRRHGEIAWRLTPTECKRELPDLQLALLRAAARRVAEGGELIYATCSVLRAENQDVVQAFLSSEEGARFKLAPVSGLLEEAGAAYARAACEMAALEDEHGCFQSVPAPGGYDGHFCARFILR